MAQTLTDLLLEDHVRLERLLDRAGSLRGADEREAFVQFRQGLLRHIAIEEKLLIPRARERLGEAASAPAARLRLEHAALTSLLVPTPDVALLGEIRGLLASHNAREEGPQGFYALCEQALGASSPLLAEQARAIPPVRVRPHQDGPRALRTAQAALEAAARPSRAPPR